MSSWVSVATCWLQEVPNLAHCGSVSGGQGRVRDEGVAAGLLLLLLLLVSPT